MRVKEILHKGRDSEIEFLFEEPDTGEAAAFIKQCSDIGVSAREVTEQALANKVRVVRVPYAHFLSAVVYNTLGIVSTRQS